MPRRTYTYAAGQGFDCWNLMSTFGAIIIAFSMLVFMINAFLSRNYGEIPGDDPWDGHTLEWATTSPPPAHNFDKLPMIRSRRPVWDLKYGTAVPATEPRDVKAAGSTHEDEAGGHGIHLPPPSFWPITFAFGLVMAAYGLLFSGSAFVPSIIAIVLGISIGFTAIAGLASQAAKD